MLSTTLPISSQFQSFIDDQPNIPSHLLSDDFYEQRLGLTGLVRLAIYLKGPDTPLMKVRPVSVIFSSFRERKKIELIFEEEFDREMNARLISVDHTEELSRIRRKLRGRIKWMGLNEMESALAVSLASSTSEILNPAINECAKLPDTSVQRIMSCLNEEQFLSRKDLIAKEKKSNQEEIRKLKVKYLGAFEQRESEGLKQIDRNWRKVRNGQLFDKTSPSDLSEKIEFKKKRTNLPSPDPSAPKAAPIASFLAAKSIIKRHITKTRADEYVFSEAMDEDDLMCSDEVFLALKQCWREEPYHSKKKQALFYLNMAIQKTRGLSEPSLFIAIDQTAPSKWKYL